MPDPRASDYLDKLCEQIRGHVRATDGGAFVLFTSFRTMHDVADRLRAEFEAEQHPVYVHGKDGSRSVILEKPRSIRA